MKLFLTFNFAALLFALSPTAHATSRAPMTVANVRAARAGLDEVFDQIKGHGGSGIGSCMLGSNQEAPAGAKPTETEACFVVYVNSKAALAAVKRVFPAEFRIKGVAVRFVMIGHIVAQ